MTNNKVLALVQIDFCEIELAWVLKMTKEEEKQVGHLNLVADKMYTFVKTIKDVSKIKNILSNLNCDGVLWGKGNVYLLNEKDLKKVEDIILKFEKETIIVTESDISIEKATKILKVAATRSNVLSKKEESKWLINYNNINNEGGEGYVPTRITLEDVEWAKKIINK